MFGALERLPAPEGHHIEIVEGTVCVTPKSPDHWRIIRTVLWQLVDRFGKEAHIDSDVRMDFPGYRNGFCPDLVKVTDGARPDARDQYAPKDVELVVEVISEGTRSNDYGPKKRTYAAAGVPVLLIIDPYTGRCHAHTSPQGGTYRSELIVEFGEPVDLTRTPLGLTIHTHKFPRD
ncbi:Uma2 family endonuclease [Streptomyces mobaraensis]|nr:MULTISPECIES: Uma2 family endonuclease [Streptomyces]MBC2879708.1 Uma2 family endonuclease [Streptomyces sp. TYQ1024]UBI41020.1 Uma2 family endonuclease [Streptomyces mobaraensis]UKW33504.1 Uma2 family endonuclease [Streptomyces sp. TYQ1024]